MIQLHHSGGCFPQSIKVNLQEILHSYVLSWCYSLKASYGTVTVSISVQMDEQVWYVCTIVFYLAIKKNEMRRFVRKWMGRRSLRKGKYPNDYSVFFSNLKEGRNWRLGRIIRNKEVIKEDKG